MNFTFDGIPTSFLLHTVQQVQDGGSIAMLNGDILDGITLMNGSYPQRYGNRLGAELDFHMRDGSRDRTQTRVGVSGTDASIVVEGPLGRAKAGSWLVSARKSYLELLLKQIQSEEDGDSFGFGFSDVQAKMVYDFSTRQHVELSLVAGQSRLDQNASAQQHRGRRRRPESRGARQHGLAVHAVAAVRPHRACGGGDADLQQCESRGLRARTRLGPRHHVANRFRGDGTSPRDDRRRRAGAGTDREETSSFRPGPGGRP